MQDPNEAGIAGVTVALLVDSNGDGIYGGAGDNPAVTTTTNATGNYIFTGLEPGAYVVQVTDTAMVLGGYTQTGDPDHFGQTNTSPAANDGLTTTPVVLGPGDVFLNADFGYQPPAAENNSIGDTVWFDANADGAQGAGEPGIPGVTVALIQDTNGDGTWDPGEPIIASDTTDATGKYLFPGLPDGKYLVWVNDTDNVLGNLVGTYDSNGGATATGSGAPIGVASSTVLGLSASSLDPGGTNGSPVNDDAQDFGYTAPGQDTGEGLIGDTIFFDANPGDGNAYNPVAGDTPIEGVVVELRDSNGNVIATTTTDENGNYYFGGLDPNNVTYTVTVAASNFGPGGVLQGMANTADPDGGNNSTSNTTLTPGNPIDLNQDFGYRAQVDPGTIGDLVWEDLNADGVKDANEPGIEGVTLDLYRDLNDNGKVDPGEPRISTQTTGANGAYLFTGLATTDNGAGQPGADYIVDVTDTNGVLVGYWHSLGAPNTSDNSQVDPYAASISVGTPNNLTADFGYYVKPATVGNFVWNDLNGNGIQDSGEPGIPGFQVELTITYPDGTVVTVTTVTDSNGYYSFGNLLLDEDYNIGTAGDPATTGLPKHTISVAPPPGYTPTTTTDTGTVFTSGMADSNLNTGTLAQPIQGLTNTSQNADPSLETSPAASYDFGFVRPVVSIGSYVWSDVNNNGLQDETKTGISGATVRLLDNTGNPATDINGNPVAAQTTTGTGQYYFSNLAPGTYQVEVTPPAGYAASGTQATGAINGSANSNIVANDSNIASSPSAGVYLSPLVTLTAGSEPTEAGGLSGDAQDDAAETDGNMTVDFGFVQPVAVGNRVWLDNGAVGGTASNGIQDGTEPGVDGVRVELYTSAGVFVDFTTTSGGGYYYFDNLEPGVYYVNIPGSEFGVGRPLEGLFSSSPTNSDETTDLDDNGINDAAPATNGIKSSIFNLTAGGMPTGEDQIGYPGSLLDNSVNATCDLGFQAKTTAVALRTLQAAPQAPWQTVLELLRMLAQLAAR